MSARKERARKWLRCKVDPEYFIRNFVKIVHQEKGIIPFDMYEFQERALSDLFQYDYTITLKARQMGLTTLLSAYALWLMIFEENKEVLALSYKQTKARNIIKKIKRMNSHLPSWMKESTPIDNQLEVEFGNGSKASAESTTSDAGRSESASFVIIDEAAFIDNAAEVWSAVKLTLDVGGGTCAVLSCVTDDTYVFTNEGLTQVSEITENLNGEGDYAIPGGYSVLGKNKMRKGQFFKHNGTAETKIVETKFGSVQGTPNHKLFSCSSARDFGWKKIKNISEGDWVPIQYGMEKFGGNDSLEEVKVTEKMSNVISNEKITPDLAYLFGAYISEGSCYIPKNSDGSKVGASFTFTCEDPIIEEVCENLGLNVSCHDGIHRNVSSKTLLQIFESVGFDLGSRAHEKEIPSKLLKMSKENIIALLQGIFDGDGWSRKKRGTVGFVSVSEELVNQVRLLLQNLGILSSKSRRSKEYFNDRNDFGHDYDFNHDVFSLSLSKGNSRKFHKKIGFRLKRKQEEVEIYERANTKDTVPHSLDIVHELFNAAPFGAYTFRKKHDINLGGNLVNKTTRYKTEHISREKILDLLEVCGQYISEERESEIREIVNENIRWTKVKSVEEGEEKETYDFSLPDKKEDDWAHSVTYNGIIGHQTPTGVGTWFHETWQKATRGDRIKKLSTNPEVWKGVGENDFHPIKLHWSLHPERDQEWRDEQTRTMGEKKAARECDCDFSTSGDTVIDQQIIKWYDKVATKEPVETHRRGKGDVWIWNQPSPGNTYIMASDVARGDGDDYSTFQIYEATKMEQVAEYKGKIPPSEFGNLLYTYGSMFNDALLVIERDSYGWTAMQRVIDRNYPNLLYTSNDLKLVEIDRDKAFGKDKKMNPGLDTNRNTRGLIISTLQRFMRKKWIHCKSSRFTEELQTFIWKNKGTRQKPEHMDGYNDDLVFAAAFACWARDKALKYRAEMGQRSQESLDNIKGSQRIYSGKQDTMDPYVQDVGGHKEDMRWLLE